MRILRTLLLSAGTILALCLTLTPSSASAQAFPLGDNNPNNWRAVTVKKPGTPPIACSGTGTPTTFCTADTGQNFGNQWTWRLWPGTSQESVQACNDVRFKIRAAADGRTIVDSGSWNQTGNPAPTCQYNDLQGYAARPDLEADLNGRICHHVPTGRTFLHQKHVQRNWSSGILTKSAFFSELTGTAFANQVMETTQIKTAGHPGWAPTNSTSIEVQYSLPFVGWRIQPTGAVGAPPARLCF